MLNIKFKEPLMRFFNIEDKFIEAFFHTIWHLFGTLLPLFIAFILAWLFNCFESIEHFITRGEFCILSAAILTPASFILSQHSRDESGKFRKWPSLVYGIAIIIILATSILFAGVYMKGMYDFLIIDACLVKWISIISLIIATIIFFIAQVINNSPPTNAKLVEVNQINSINDEFDNLP